ncbi:MAG TPA: lipid-A-disaccharide synthase [Rudaea sp.]|nr:lipid-A-disaccharide synthase [Rudaea sp.]
MTESPLPTSDSPLFVLVAGEASGDQLGANLIAGLRRHFPTARFAGIGGPLMAAAGMEIWHAAERLSVMGLFEVLPRLPELLGVRRDVVKRTLQRRPLAFIGIDSPDFNLGLSRKLKRAGIVCVHYVSPSVWAWRERRVEKIGNSTDLVLCLFPMEPEIYRRHGVDARFVGHPLAAKFALLPDQSAARRELGLPADVPVMALLPGSRLGEIRRLGADFLAAARLLKQQLPDLHIVAPMANARCRAAFESLIMDPQSRPALSLLPDLKIIDGNAHTAMIAADAVLLASGTAALEAMLAKRPLVVAYRLAAATYWLVKRLGLLRTKVYSLPNILAGKALVPELMQDACTPDALAAALLPLLQARGAADDLIAQFTRVHETLRADAAHDAATQIATFLAPTNLPVA